MSTAEMQEHYDLLRATSRTFAVGIEALPGRLRDAVTLAYLVLRVSDYFEDSPSLSVVEKKRSLETWAELVEDAGNGRPPSPHEPTALIVSEQDKGLPDQLAAQRSQDILRGLASLPANLGSIISDHTVATTRGMTEWVVRGDEFPDESSLDDYMFEVAGRVGILLTDLFVEYDPRMRARQSALSEAAVSFGLGLQTVNVIRGLHEDPARGWNYVPRTVLPMAGTDPVDPRHLPDADRKRILDFLVRKAGGHVADAFRYCQALPPTARGVRIFCIVPALIASRTAAAAHGNLDVFREPVKIGRKEVGKLILLSRCLFFSNRWLERERLRAESLADRTP